MSNEQSGSGQSVGGGVDPDRWRQWTEKRVDSARASLHQAIALWPVSAIDRARRILREGR